MNELIYCFFRCIFFIQILLAYAFLLATTGPARNTFHNMNILSDSLTCTQDQLAKAAKNIQVKQYD